MVWVFAFLKKINFSFLFFLFSFFWGFFCGPKISENKASPQELWKLWIKQNQFELGAYSIEGWKRVERNVSPKR